MTLTEKIKKEIESKRLTITALADLLGLSRPTIYERLEKSNWKKLEVIQLNKII